MADSCSGRCLNLAPCVNGTCVCSATPFLTIDDNVFLRTGNNCGVVLPALISAYILTWAISFSVAIASYREAFKQKVKFQKYFLLSNGTGSIMTGMFCVSHWAEGHRMGTATSIILGCTLNHLNVQLFFFQLLIFSTLLRVTISPASRLEQLRKNLMKWNGFWFTVKVISVSCMVAGQYISDRFFDIALIITMLLVFTEVMCQSVMTARVFQKLYSNLEAASRMAQGSTNELLVRRRMVVEDFARKIVSQQHLTYAYAVCIFGITMTIIGLFVGFNGNIPYSWLLWSLYAITWPTLCIGVILLMRETPFKPEKTSSSDLGPTGTPIVSPKHTEAMGPFVTAKIVNDNVARHQDANPIATRTPNSHEARVAPASVELVASPGEGKDQDFLLEKSAATADSA